MLQRLPWSPAKATTRAPRYKLTGAKRRALVAGVADVLRRGDPTVFALSATCRHSLRIVLVLHSWPWIIADLTSAGIVDRALRQVGAEVPRWIEGQPEYVATPGYSPPERYQCMRCGRPVPEGRRLYCSHRCKNVHANERRNRELEVMTTAERDAAKLIRRQLRKDHFASLRTITCAWCGGMHTPPPMSNPRTFCSRSCAAKARWEDRRASAHREIVKS